MTVAIDLRLLHLVMADGTLATLTLYRAEQVTAWTRQETAGLVSARSPRSRPSSTCWSSALARCGSSSSTARSPSMPG